MAIQGNGSGPVWPPLQPIPLEAAGGQPPTQPGAPQPLTPIIPPAMAYPPQPLAPPGTPWYPQGPGPVAPYQPDVLAGTGPPRGAAPAVGPDLYAPSSQGVQPAPPVKPEQPSVWERVKKGANDVKEMVTKPSVWPMLLGAVLGALFLGGIIALLGAPLFPVLMLGLMGLVVGALAGMPGPGAESDSAAPPPAAAPAAGPPTAPPKRDDSNAWVAETDELLQRSTQARDRAEAEALRQRLDAALYGLQRAMNESIAEERRRQEYGEYARRFVLASRARDDLRLRFGLP